MNLQLATVVVIFTSFLLSWIFLFFLIPLLKLKFSDTPNERSSHTIPTPRAGGIVFLLISIFFSIYSLFKGQSTNLNLLILFSVPLSIVGLLDDLLHLPSLFRYVVQLITAFLLVSLTFIVRFDIV